MRTGGSLLRPSRPSLRDGDGHAGLYYVTRSKVHPRACGALKGDAEGPPGRHPSVLVHATTAHAAGVHSKIASWP